MKELLNAGANINLYDNDGRTAVLEAAFNGHFDCLKELISAGAVLEDPECPCEDTLISAAVRSSNIDCIKLVLSTGVEVNVAAEYHDYPIMCATRLNRPDIVLLLLQAGADPNLAGKYSETALVIAAENGYDKCLRHLLAAGADINIAKYGDTPMKRAQKKGRTKCLRILQKHSNYLRRRNFLCFLYASGIYSSKSNNVNHLISSPTKSLKKGTTSMVLSIKDLTHFIADYL